jgi:hypothetical protein
MAVIDLDQFRKRRNGNGAATDAPVVSAGRLPHLGKLRAPTRQQLRRLTLKEGVCCRCGQPLRVWQKPLLDDGKDAHMVCSLSRNIELRKLAREFAWQDHQMWGTTAPTMPMRPWQPMQQMIPISPRRRLQTPA